VCYFEKDLELRRKLADYLKFKLFWKFPEVTRAAIILDQDLTTVHGMVKKGYALIKSLPEPSTGYRYKDIVKVTKTNYVQYYREDKIPEYEAISVYKRSKHKTFSFELKLCDYIDYFPLQDNFKEFDQKILIPDFKEDKVGTWLTSYCSSNDIDQARTILNRFIELNKNCEIRNIKLASKTAHNNGYRK
jgi:hypothetical protein